MAKIDYKDVRQEDLKQKLRKKLIAVEQEYVAKHKPFCYKAAKEYYEDTIDNIVKEAYRKEGSMTEADLKLPDIDFHKFGDIKDFKEISRTTKKGTIKKGNTILEEWIEFIDYVYTPKGYKISIEQPVNAEEPKAVTK